MNAPFFVFANRIVDTRAPRQVLALPAQRVPLRGDSSTVFDLECNTTEVASQAKPLTGLHCSVDASVPGEPARRPEGTAVHFCIGHLCKCRYFLNFQTLQLSATSLCNITLEEHRKLADRQEETSEAELFFLCHQPTDEK